MATITKIKEKKKIENIKVEIDVSLIEFIYTTDLEKLLKDDDLMDIILSNGYYKSALCEAYGVEQLEISHKGTDHFCAGPPEDISSTLDLVLGKTQCKALDVELINESL